MHLYLVRHASAEDRAEDALRPLSAEGRTEIRRVAEHLAAHGLKDLEIWHSPLLRATQTAETLAKALASEDRLEEEAALSPGQPISTLVPRLTSHAHDLMLVGHQPFLGRLCSLLLSGQTDADFIGLAKAGVACLAHDDDGPWTLVWLLRPELIA
jgi:phosphohistidine phosphatase